MNTTEKRESWLVRILAPFQAKQVQQQLSAKRAETREAQAALDAVGIERKEVSDKQPDADPNDQTEPPDEQVENDPVLKVAQALTEQIKAGVQGDYSKLTDEGLIATLTNAMREAMPEDPIDREETQPEEITMADDNKKKNGTSEVSKAFTDTLDTMVKDQGEMAQAIIEQQSELKELKSLKPAVEELTKTVTAMQALLAQRPRAASQSDETEPTLDEKERKALEETILKGVDGTPKIVLGGLPVKNIPK